MLQKALDLVHLDFAPHHQQPSNGRVVLATLVSCANAVVPAATLVDIVWADDPPPSALGTLRKYVHRLRNTIEPGRSVPPGEAMLRACAPGYLLEVEPGRLDAARFEAFIGDARRWAARGELGEASAALCTARSL